MTAAQASAVAAALRALADALVAPGDTGDADELVPLAALPHGGRDFWRARIRAGEIAAVVGPRRKTLVRRRDADRLLASRPVRSGPPDDDDVTADLIRRGRLARVA